MTAVSTDTAAAPTAPTTRRLVAAGVLTPLADTIAFETSHRAPIGPDVTTLTNEVTHDHNRAASLDLLTAEAVNRYGYQPWSPR